MKLSQTPPSTPLLELPDVLTHLRLIDGTDEADYITALIAAATAHAEQAMACSLLTRTITATFYAGETMQLPRGPVQAVTAVAVNGVPVASSAYSTEQYGHAVLLRYNGGMIQPLAAPAVLTVTYTAGYGDTPDAVPADVIAAIRAHVGLLYENREVASERTIKPVPFLEDFYRLRALDVGVG